jgi:hypothetical protein
MGDSLTALDGFAPMDGIREGFASWSCHPKSRYSHSSYQGTEYFIVLFAWFL